MRIIVSGYIGTFCISGITWHYVQYPVGLQLLGHDVYYLEDTLSEVYVIDSEYKWGDPTPVVNYLEKTMNFFGLTDRWAYRDGVSGKSFGLSEKKLQKICSSADMIISVSNSLYLREEYMNIPVRILIDTDPMFTQTPNLKKGGSNEQVKSSLSNYTHLFSFGENIMSGDAMVPTHGLQWLPTRQPVCLKYWQSSGNTDESAAGSGAFTTIMNLASRNEIIYNNERWGQKDIELKKIVELPERFSEVPFEMAVAGSANEDLNHNWLRDKGWQLSKDLNCINNSMTYYVDYIKNSFAEFSVAKEAYVKAKTGWFSDRSACYLASGKPVVVQDTQWSKNIPSGKGLLSFTSLDSALEAVKEVSNDYKTHSIAAKEIANEYFDSGKVLAQMLEKLS
jgi:hypothetical protein